MGKSLRRWVWLGVGTLILGLIVFNLRHSPEWRNFNWRRLWFSLLTAQPGLLFLALVAVFASHLVRAYRWKYLMSPVKRGSLAILFKAQVLGFSSIYLIGRTGEFVRPAYIAKKEKISVSSMVAVWLLERILDQTALALLFTLAIFALPATLMSSRGAGVLSTLQHAGDILLVLTVAVVIGLVAFRLKTKTCTDFVMRLLRFLPARAHHHAEHFLAAFADGLQVVHGFRNLLVSIFWTAIVWGVNATVFWLVMKSLGGRVGELPWLAAALVMFCAGLGLLVQFPGIGGGYQVATILALTAVFGVAADIATGVAILTWLMISLPVMALGLGILVHEGLSLRKLEVMADEEREAVVGVD